MWDWELARLIDANQNHFPAVIELPGIGGIPLKENTSLAYLNQLLACQHTTTPRTLVKAISEQLPIKPKTLPEDIGLDWWMIREMNKNGCSFGAHTCTHPSLAHMSIKDAQNEIVQSRATIQEQLNVDKSVPFAFPFGKMEHCSKELITLIEKNGFSCAMLNVPGLNRPSSCQFGLYRLAISNNTFLPGLIGELWKN